MKNKVFFYTYTTVLRMLIIIVRPFLSNESFNKYLQNSLAMRTKIKMILLRILNPPNISETLFYLNHRFYNLKNLIFIKGLNIFYEKIEKDISSKKLVYDFSDINMQKTFNYRIHDFLHEKLIENCYFDTFQVLENFGYIEIFTFTKHRRLEFDQAKQFYILAYYIYLKKCQAKFEWFNDQSLNQYIEEFDGMLKDFEKRDLFIS